RTDLLDEALPIPGIGQALRGEFGGAQLKVRPGELRLLLHGLPGIDGDIPQEACRVRAGFEEAALLDDPAVAVRVEVALTDHVAVAIPLGRFDLDRILSHRAQPHLIAHRRLSERFLEGAPEIDAPDGSIAAGSFHSHEV